jgi:uncharacterized membrane protein required for colicin V production
MIVADWIVLAFVLGCAVIGIILGLAKVIKIFTSGIFGIIISIIVAYFLYGVVISWGITQALIEKLDEALLSGNGFTQFLYNAHIETIVVAIVLFVIVQLLRLLIVNLFNSIINDSEVAVIVVVNKALGLILMLAIFTMFLLLVFQVAAWIGGTTDSSFALSLQGSFFKLNKLFENNPLNAVIALFVR